MKNVGLIGLMVASSLIRATTVHEPTPWSEIPKGIPKAEREWRKAKKKMAKQAKRRNR